MRSSIVTTIQVAGYLFELLLTWFKKYHLLFPNYNSAFISSLNCLYQRDYNVIPAAEILPSKCVKTCQILQKHPETARIFAADSVAPTENINFIVSDGTRSPMKDIISVKQRCLLSLQLVETLLQSAAILEQSPGVFVKFDKF